MDLLPLLRMLERLPNLGESLLALLLLVVRLPDGIASPSDRKWRIHRRERRAGAGVIVASAPKEAPAQKDAERVTLRPREEQTPPKASSSPLSSDVDRRWLSRDAVCRRPGG